MADLLTALALVLVIEGLLYGAAPSTMQRMARQAADLPPSTLRGAGLTAAVIGVALVWFIRG